jgi:uroporphyrinogen decarboxylase
MIPTRMTGKPYWESLLFNNPPHWQAYLNAADYFGIDAWFTSGLDYQYDDGVTVDSQVVKRTEDSVVNRWTAHTPEGDLWQERYYPHDDPDTLTRKWIKDLETQLHMLKYVFRVPTGYSRETMKMHKKAIAGRHAIGAGTGIPGFHWWSTDTLDGGLEELSILEMERPDLVEEMRARHYDMALRHIEFILDSREFDYVFIGASGGITLSSPHLFDKYALPFIKQATKMCKEAGIPTLLHSCGKETHIVKRAFECTDLSCINPLEIAPMGDCDLAEIKRLYGGKLAMMGNLHTTEVMLRGTVEQVKKAACLAIDDAGARGGFILSTGDQCGRDTPDENIFALVDVCKSYGKYN